LFPETLLLVYSAKKRAEVAPGVGEATDMFGMSPNLGSYFEIGEHVIANLEKIYQIEQKRERRAAIKAKESVEKYVQALTRAKPPEEQASPMPDSGGDAPPDEKELRDNTEGNQSEG
jgi:polyribonucleotide nucleotidyltransferase